MQIDLNVHLFHHAPDESKVEQILALVQQLLTQGEGVTMTLAELQAEVTRNTAVDQSALLLIQEIVARLEAAGTDPAAIQALHDDLKASTDSLAAAVAANTPASPQAARK